jgi:hypothetical protein
MAGVDPIVGAGDAADPIAGADRVVAVDAAARVAGSHRHALTDPFTGTGVCAGAVAARVARQVGERTQVILAAGCHRGNSATRTQLRATTGVPTTHALTWTAVFMPKAQPDPHEATPGPPRARLMFRPSASPSQPSMAEMVPEPARVHRDPRPAAALGDDLVDAAGGQRPPVVPAGAKGRVGGKAFDQMAGELKA